MEQLSGRVALVIGSASGIGAASARTLARRGARVMLADIAADAAAELAAALRAEGLDAESIACDVGEEEQLAAAVAAAVERWGRLDILHNNAAAMHLVPHDGRVEDADAEHWDETLRINLRGQLLGSKHAIPVMRAGGGGSIVNTASASGALGDLGQSAYGASKAAVVQLTRAIATQYGRDGIRCNAIIPGLIDVNRKPGTGMKPERRVLLERHQVLSLHAGPDEVADVVAFLAGDDSRFITGQALVVDGGLMSHLPSYADLMQLDEETAR